jgi:hypothetical protein
LYIDLSFRKCYDINTIRDTAQKTGKKKFALIKGKNFFQIIRRIFHMNMKKTIAAAAAGAMAVSATATAASAATTPAIAPEGSYTYKLVKNFAQEKIGTATITSERQIAGLTAASTVVINLVGVGANSDSADYIKVDTKTDANLYVQSTSNQTTLVDRTFILDGDDANANLGSLAADDISIIKDDADAAIVDSAITDFIVLDEASAVARTYNSILVKYTAKVEHNYTKTNLLREALVDGGDAEYVLGIAQTNVAVANSTQVSFGTSFDFEQAYRQVTAFSKYDPYGTILNAPMLSHTNTKYYDNGVPNILAYLEGRDSSLNANGSAANNGGWYVYSSANYPEADTTLSGLRGIQYIGQATSWETGKGVSDTGDYYNVTAAINDVAANYDLLFTFNTAADKVYDAAKERAKPGDGVMGTYDADGTDTYMSFGQHLYGYYGQDYTNTPFGQTYYFNNNPANPTYNLFTGALIVNDYYSMQLSDTTLFSYSAIALTFKYADVEANANAQYNSWMDYIQSLRLATSTEWYWDSMTITWTTPVADTAGVGEGLEEDDVTLEEEEVPADEEVVVEEPVAPVENPPTGNSAVALAVIPVALAAAAIVAKKRK